MAKYGGAIKYGGGALGGVYGTGDAVEYLTWYFGVFWDDAFVDEAGIMMDLQTDRGRDHLLSSGGAWERFRAGEASGTFDNEDGRFDPYNTGGPLYGFLLPGRLVRITVAVKPPYSDTTTTYDVLRGIIDDIRTNMNDGQRRATIIVKDGLEWLARRSIALALVEDAEALDTAAAIAAQVGFDDVDDWTIEQLGPDSVVVPFAFGNGNSAISLINEFVDAEAGQVFHAKDGALTFVTNDYTETDETDIDDAQGHITRDFELKQPWEVVRTRAQVTANPLVEGAGDVLWTFGNEGEIATWTAVTVTNYPTSPYLIQDLNVSTSLTVDAVFTGTGAGGPALSPVVDYEAVAGAYLFPGSNWADDTGNPILTTTDIGNGLRLTWTSSAGAVNLVITFADVTATPLVPGDIVVTNASDLAAIVIYGEKTFELDNPWVQTQAYAQEYADYIVTELKDAHLFPTIIIENRGSLQYGPELYVSKIHLTIPTYGIDDTFRVGKISHKWLNGNGFAVQTTLKLEPVLGVL